MGTMHTRKPPHPVHYDVEDDDNFYATRMPSSTRRYRASQSIHDTIDDPAIDQAMLTQRRRASLHTQPTHGVASKAVSPSQQRRKRRSPLVAVLIGMVLTVIVAMTLSALGNWWKIYQDDQHYGRPRTSQLDAVVGHNDSERNPTHFIFININRHIEVIEIPGGDVTRTRTFTGPVLFGDGQELTPVTGEIRVIDGRRDLVLHIQNQQIVFVNDGTTFHPQ